MSNITVEIEFPEELLIGLNVEPAYLQQQAKEWIALEMFRQGHISAGKAAEFLNLTKNQFITLLGARAIPYLDLAADELLEDVQIAQAATHSVDMS